MAKGEKTFSTAGLEARKFESKPIPTGDYRLKLDTSRAEISKRPEPGKFPFIKYSYEALDTASDGGKNRRVFHMLFTSLKPGSDGVPMPHRANQLLGLAKALGVEANLPLKEYEDENGSAVDCVNPAALLKWLQGLDGSVVSAHVKIKKGTNGYSDSNDIAYFEPSDEENELEAEDDVEEDDEETDEVESEDDDEVEEDEGEAEEDPDEEEPEEEEPAPRKKSAPAVKKPVKKGKR